MGLAVAVQPHDRAERAELEPARKALVEGRIANVAAVEAADIRRPPRNSGNAHVQARRKLAAQRTEAGVNVAAPHERAVALAAHPGAANQAENFRLSLGLQTLVGHAGILARIQVSDLQIRAAVVAVLAVLVPGVLRLRLVKPEHADAAAVIVVAQLVPDVAARFRICHVGKARAAQMIHAVSVLAARQQAKLAHLAVVDALLLHRRPYGNHQLDAHFLQLPHHGGGIRPVFRIKAPVALMRPVEIIDHDDRDRQAAALILARDGEQLLLRLIAQLTLPETRRPGRHQRSLAHRVRVGFLDLRRGIARRDPVVHLFRGVHRPLRQILRKHHLSDGGIVPQKAVAAAGEHKGNACLGVALRELHNAALEIEVLLLVLAHAEKLLVLRGLKAHLQAVLVCAEDRAEGARADLQRAVEALVLLAEAVAVVLLQQQRARVGAQKAQLAGGQHVAAELAVRDARPCAVHGDRRLARGGGQQSKILVVEEGRLRRRAHAQAVFAPRLDAQQLLVKAPE